MPNLQKLEALRAGINLAIGGKVGAAKYRLGQAMPNAAAALILAQLYARSRSVRASRRALIFLSHAINQADKLDGFGRQADGSADAAPGQEVFQAG